MNTNLATLFDDLMALCAVNEAFYFVDQIGPDGLSYRVFTYRLASYTDFQNRNAVECRGHTFRLDDDGQWRLASLPMQKFFNYGEHIGWGTEMNLSKIVTVMDKLDGSLISTVVGSDGIFFLKSKTSFRSQQATDATEWLAKTADGRFVEGIYFAVKDGYTVNFEWVSPDNQIVIGYAEPKLIVLNARHMETGEYMSRENMVRYFLEGNIVKSFDLPADPHQFMLEAEKMNGIEGFIICFENGLWVKHKTEAYCVLHHLKDSINNARRLWEACVNETADDLRALFHEDPVSIAKIVDMEEKASKTYSHIHRVVHSFYADNKHLERKEYAIKGQAELTKEGLFSLAMNLYLGKDADIKAFMVKNYKKFGISDEEEVSE